MEEGRGVGAAWSGRDKEGSPASELPPRPPRRTWSGPERAFAFCTDEPGRADPVRESGAAGRSNSWRNSRRGRGSGRGSGRAEWQASARAARPGRCPAGSYGAPQRVLLRGLGHGAALRTRVTDTVPVLEASSVCALIFCFPLPFSPVIRFPFVVGEPQSKTLAAWQPALPTDMTVSNAGLGNLKKFAPASRTDAPGAPGAPSPASRPPFAPAARG